MSRSEIERFAADLNANASLRAEARKIVPDGSSGLPLDSIVSFATSRGYAVTADAVIAFAKSAQAATDGKRLSDAELDGVAGGAADSSSRDFVYLPIVHFEKEHIPIDIVQWECVVELVPVAVPSLSEEEFIAPSARQDG